MDAADRHVCFRGARRIPRKLFWTPNNYSQSFESAPKNATRRLRGGYATRKYRPETNWLRIGTALAPEHSKRLGVTNQTQGANRQTLDDAHGTITPCVQQKKTDIIKARNKWHRTRQTEEGKERNKGSYKSQEEEEEEAWQRRAGSKDGGNNRFPSNAPFERMDE
jgi:hypothetical protein